MSAVEVSFETPEPMPLAHYESIIETGLRSFVDVGNAFLAIKANKQYRSAGYSTFEDYCERRWNIGRAYGHRLVLAAATAEALVRGLTEMSPDGDIPLPTTEAQVRPLSKLRDDPGTAAEAWTEAVEAAAGKQPTAPMVAEAVSRRLQEIDDTPTPKPPVEIVVPDEVIPAVPVSPYDERTAEEVAADRDAQLRRTVKRLSLFASLMPVFEALHTNPNRADLLRSLPEVHRQIILTAERKFTWTRN